MHAGIAPAMDAGIAPLWTEFFDHASENITLPQTSFAGGNRKDYLLKRYTVQSYGYNVGL